MEEMIKGLIEQIDRGFNQVNEKIDNLDRKITEEVNRLDIRIAEEVNRLDSRITEEVNKLDNRITEEVSKLGDRMAIMEANIMNEHEITREELKYEIQSNYSEMTDLKSDFTTVKLVTADNMKTIAKIQKQQDI